MMGSNAVLGHIPQDPSLKPFVISGGPLRDAVRGSESADTGRRVDSHELGSIINPVTVMPGKEQATLNTVHNSKTATSGEMRSCTFLHNRP